MPRPKKLVFDPNDKQLMLGSFIPEANRMIDIRTRMTAAMSKFTKNVENHAELLKKKETVTSMRLYCSVGIDIVLEADEALVKAAIEGCATRIQKSLEEIRAIAKEIVDG